MDSLLLYQADDLISQLIAPIKYMIPKHTGLAWMCEDISISLNNRTSTFYQEMKNNI